MSVYIVTSVEGTIHGVFSTRQLAEDWIARNGQHLARVQIDEYEVDYSGLLSRPPEPAKEQRMIYLASPYSHPDEAVRVARFEAVCHAASRLMTEGHFIFSPIAHSHPIAVAGGLPLGWDFWEHPSREMLRRCDELWVLCLAGWENSEGVTAEIRWAKQANIPVTFIEFEIAESGTRQ